MDLNFPMLELNLCCENARQQCRSLSELINLMNRDAAKSLMVSVQRFSQPDIEVIPEI